jgi:hypothetical protein
LHGRNVELLSATVKGELHVTASEQPVPPQDAGHLVERHVQKETLMVPNRPIRFVFVPCMVAGALAASFFVACSQGNAAADRDGGGRDTGSQSGNLLSDGGTGGGAGSCARAGTTQSCWTGPASQRDVGACHDGTQQCIPRRQSHRAVRAKAFLTRTAASRAVSAARPSTTRDRIPSV